MIFDVHDEEDFGQFVDAFAVLVAAVFARAEVNARPAPVGFVSPSVAEPHWYQYLPDGNALVVTESALHEWLGIAWASLLAWF